MHIFTGRNEVVAKVIFLHLFVILYTGGCSASMHAGIPTPLDQANTPLDWIRHQADPLPWTRQTPPQDQTPPPDQADPPQIRHTPPGSDTTPPWIRHHHPPPTRQTLPPGSGTTPPGSRLQHTVYKRPVRILLECILVILCFWKKWYLVPTGFRWNVFFVEMSLQSKFYTKW